MRLSEIALSMKARLLGDDGVVASLRPLYAARTSDLSVLAWPKDIRLAKKSKAAALIISSDWAADYADELSSSLLVIDDLGHAFSCLAKLQAQGFGARQIVKEQKIHKTALIASSAHVAKAIIGSHTLINHNAVIEDDVIIGSHCSIGHGVSIYRGSKIGDYCVIGSNSCIGSKAFSPVGDILMPELLDSLGDVSIANHVSIGALCSIDRGLLGTTTLQDSCKLDNQVHIGHDAYLGQAVIIAAQSAIAGFVQIGANATIGGQAGVAPHLQIGSYARISAKTFVHKNLKDFALCSGNPGLPHELYLRAYKKFFAKQSGI